MIQSRVRQSIQPLVRFSRGALSARMELPSPTVLTDTISAVARRPFLRNSARSCLCLNSIGNFPSRRPRQVTVGKLWHEPGDNAKLVSKKLRFVGEYLE